MLSKLFFYYLVNSRLVPFPLLCKRAADGKFNFQLREFESVLRVPLPPLSEQRAIAGVLGKLQAAVAARQAIIDRTAELKAALMAKLFTEGTRGEPMKGSSIGPIPISWLAVPLASLISIANGQVDPKVVF